MLAPIAFLLLAADNLWFPSSLNLGYACHREIQSTCESVVQTLNSKTLLKTIICSIN